MNYSRCIESVGYAHVLSVTLYFVAVYSRGFEASNLEHVSRLMLLTIVASCAFSLEKENCFINSHNPGNFEGLFLWEHVFSFDIVSITIGNSAVGLLSET